MVKTTDVLVIGCGVMGASTAYHLSRLGVRTTVLERNPAPGAETTARSGAIIRAHYGIPMLVSLAQQANVRYMRFKEEVGASCGFTPCGYCVLVDTADASTLKACAAMQRDFGVNVRLIGPDDLKKMVPAVKTDDVALVAWEPDGGFASPAKTVTAYLQAAKGNGAEVIVDAPVTGASRDGAGWTVTYGSGGMISAGQVILTTGNWSKPAGSFFGLELPVTPARAQIVVLERPPSFSGPFPVVSDLVNLAYFRADGDRGVWVGSSDSADLGEYLPAPEGFDESAGKAAVDAAKRKAALRFDGMDASATVVQRGFAGLYETTPDWQPIVDSFGGSLHAAVGFSGHGFKLAPVVGEELAARATGGVTRSEWSIFALSRFANERPIRSHYPYQRAKFLR